MGSGEDGKVRQALQVHPEDRRTRRLAITEGLGGSDRGRLAEKWYRRAYAPDSATQIAVSSETLNGLRPAGKQSDQGRRLDMVDANGTVREIKHISGPLSKRDLDQFADILEIVGGETTLSDPRVKRQHGNEVEARRAVLTFTDPKGARTNLEWIRRTLRDQPDLTIEVFDKNGGLWSLTDDRLSDLNSIQFE